VELKAGGGPDSSDTSTAMDTSSQWLEDDDDEDSTPASPEDIKSQPTEAEESILGGVSSGEGESEAANSQSQARPVKQISTGGVGAGLYFVPNKLERDYLGQGSERGYANAGLLEQIVLSLLNLLCVDGDCADEVHSVVPLTELLHVLTQYPPVKPLPFYARTGLLLVHLSLSLSHIFFLSLSHTHSLSYS